MSDITQMRKLVEQAMVDDKALRQQLTAANERITVLKSALRGMVEGSIPAIPAGYSASNEQVNPPVCRMIDYDTWMAAKALLDGHG